MALLTDRQFATGVTLNDLIHIVITGDTSQNAAGSSYKASFSQVVNTINDNISGYWGSFISTVDQSILVAGTTYKMSADTTTSSSGVTLSANTKFVVSKDGAYNIQFSAQLNKSSGTKGNVFIWLSKNGTDVPISNTDVTLAGGSNERLVAAWNWVEECTAGSYFEILWAGTQNNIFLDYDAAPTYGPEIPSLIVTVTQV